MSSGIEGDLDDEFGREIELENLYENIKSLEERNAILVDALKNIIVDAGKGDGTSTECQMAHSAEDALKKAGVE